MISIYTSGFNLIRNSFDYKRALDNFCAFAEEVVICINKSDDDTLAVIKSLSYPNLKVIEADLSYDDITFDGKLKDIALQATTLPIKVHMDMDEIIPLSQRERWYTMAKWLQSHPAAKAIMLPSVDLWGDDQHIRADNPIGMKYRMHKAGLKRGVRKDAWRGKYFDTSISDSCELIDQNDNLVPAVTLVPPQYLIPNLAHLLCDYMYTIHTGYLSFDQRIKVNNAIWKDHWPKRSGHEEDVATDARKLKEIPTIKHGLPI